MFKRQSTINFPIILRVMGLLLIIESLFMLIPFGVSIIYNDESFMSFVYSILITAGAGMLMLFGIKAKNKEMGKRDAIFLTSMVWALFAFFGMLPFIFCAPHLGFADAYFEAVSGFTTTGASVIRDVEAVPHGLLFWRALMQWIGGMGIILFTLAVVPMLNHQGGIQLFNAEVTGISHDKLRPRISETAKGLWGVYVVISIAMVLLLWIGPMNLFDSICQMMATVSTGGFSTRNASIASWNSTYIKVVITIFMFICGINFALLFKCVISSPKSLFKNDTFKWYTGLTAIMFLLVLVSTIPFKENQTMGEFLINPLFSVISAITSTGFAATNFEIWGQFPLALFFIMMFFGACAGSTAGGAKIDRMIFLIKNTKNEIYRVLHPNSILTVRINNKVIPFDVVSKVIAFLCIYIIIVVVASVIITALNDISVFDAFFATLSAMSNIGYGAGFSGINGSFANFDSISKIIFAIVMMIGRLEIFTFLIIFTKGFWVK